MKSNKMTFRFGDGPKQNMPLSDINNNLNLNKKEEPLVMNDLLHDVQDVCEFPHLVITNDSLSVPKSQTTWLKIFVSVVGAVAMGTIFGFIALTMFSGHFPIPGWGSQTDKIAKKGDDIRQVVQQHVTDSSWCAVKVPEQVYHVLQYGVFSTKDGVELAIEQLKQKGFAAFTETAKYYHVLAGIANTKEDTMVLGIPLQTEDTQLYVREYKIPSIQSVKFMGKADDFENFFEVSNQLLRACNHFTVQHLLHASQVASSNHEWTKLQSDHQTWTQLVQEVKTGLLEEDKKTFQSMIHAMSTLIMSLQEYDKHASPSHLREAQVATIKFVDDQRSLLHRISYNDQSLKK